MTNHLISLFTVLSMKACNVKADHPKVLVGFLATAYLTLAIVGISYRKGLVPEEFLKNVDKAILSRKLRSRPAKTWESIFRTAILMFSDQQVVTGIAIFISGYAQLPCGLSAYHWRSIAKAMKTKSHIVVGKCYV